MDVTGQWSVEADAISLPRIDEASVLTRPTSLGDTYTEREYGELAAEQEAVWDAEGERAARPHRSKARGLDQRVGALDVLLAESATEVRDAHAEHQRAARVLTPYIHRGHSAKVRYWIGLPILLAGDTAGVWSAAITNGDVPAIAFGQALAAGTAAVCAGLVGFELKDLRLAHARRRDPDTLNDEERRYQRVFTGRVGGRGIIALIGGLSLLVVALLTLGVFALRTGIEGSLSGAAFGPFAAATALASGLLGYSAGDEVADLLCTTSRRVRKAERHHLGLAGSRTARVLAEADETSRSVRAEHLLRGQAAARRVTSLGHRVSRRNPQVMGHGYPTEEPGPVGRRARGGGKR